VITQVYVAYVNMKKLELLNIIREVIEEEKPGLWANIRAKRKRVGKKGMAKKGSKAYKVAKKAGDKINKEKNEEIELKNPKKADLNKDGKLSSYEKTRGAAIEKNLKEMCGPIMEYLNEIKAEDETEFTVSLKHLLDKHVSKGGELKEYDIEFTKEDMATLHKTGKLEKEGNTYTYDEIDEFNMHTEDLLEMEVIDENITEAKYKGKTVTLNKPMQGDSKKFKVYVNSGKKNADGSIKVKKVNFGAKGMNIKKNNPKRRKAFRARHNCDNPGPKTMARYWSCKKW
jgi:hypothetical protein